MSDRFKIEDVQCLHCHEDIETIQTKAFRCGMETFEKGDNIDFYIYIESGYTDEDIFCEKCRSFDDDRFVRIYIKNGRFNTTKIKLKKDGKQLC